MPSGVEMAWIRLNVSPKISSHSAGWMARVYSSVRSCRSLRSSTQHSVIMRLASWRSPTRPLGAAPGPAGGSAQAARGAPGATDVTDASPRGVLVQRSAGEMPEHVVQGRVQAQARLQAGRGAGGLNPAAVHQREA